MRSEVTFIAIDVDDPEGFAVTWDPLGDYGAVREGSVHDQLYEPAGLPSRVTLVHEVDDEGLISRLGSQVIRELEDYQYERDFTTTSRTALSRQQLCHVVQADISGWRMSETMSALWCRFSRTTGDHEVLMVGSSCLDDIGGCQENRGGAAIHSTKLPSFKKRRIRAALLRQRCLETPRPGIRVHPYSRDRSSLHGPSSATPLPATLGEPQRHPCIQRAAQIVSCERVM